MLAILTVFTSIARICTGASSSKELSRSNNQTQSKNQRCKNDSFVSLSHGTPFVLPDGLLNFLQRCRQLYFRGRLHRNFSGPVGVATHFDGDRMLTGWQFQSSGRIPNEI